MAWSDRWKGKTAIVVGSGPSLLMGDCIAIAEARRKDSELRVLVTNSTFIALPTADVLMGHDPRWWHANRELVDRCFYGERVCVSALPSGFHVERVGAPKFQPLGNSGTAAAALAIYAGVRRVVLVGMDCGYLDTGPRKKQMRHWHDKHAPGLGNAVSARQWPNAWRRLGLEAARKGCQVFNATRGGQLEEFTRRPLHEFLAGSAEGNQ